MSSGLKKAIRQRRSCYMINDQSSITDAQIEEIVKFAVTHVPSPFNSQSARLVLLLHDKHQKFWNIVKEHLKKTVLEKDFAATNDKINAFAAGHGTILFYEDQTIVEEMGKKIAGFSAWSQHSSAMHQYAVWLMLEDEGLGASLQHYNLVAGDLAKEWQFDSNWQLIAQIPFGNLTAEPKQKQFLPIEGRMKVLK